MRKPGGERPSPKVGQRRIVMVSTVSGILWEWHRFVEYGATGITKYEQPYLLLLIREHALRARNSVNLPLKLTVCYKTEIDPSVLKNANPSALATC